LQNHFGTFTSCFVFKQIFGYFHFFVDCINNKYVVFTPLLSNPRFPCADILGLFPPNSLLRSAVTSANFWLNHKHHVCSLMMSQWFC